MTPKRQGSATGLEITLAGASESAASRAIETSVEVEREILLGEIARAELTAFARRPPVRPVEMVAPVPAALTFVADLLARIAIGTATELGPHASERRLLMAFDSAWNRVAQSRKTLFSGLSVQAISLPALEPTQPPRWIMEWKAPHHSAKPKT